MAGLKELRNRLESIKSTQKITSAMKMVAASRLRKAETMLEHSRLYSETLNLSIKRVLAAIRAEETERKIRYLLPALLRQKPHAQKFLLLVLSSDRGLCGSYNHNTAKVAAARIEALTAAGKEVRIICYGKKAFDILKKKYANKITEHYPDVASQGLFYSEAEDINAKIKDYCRQDLCDVCEIIYSQYHSALSREMLCRQVYPISQDIAQFDIKEESLLRIGNAYYDYYPDKLALLEGLLPKLAVNEIFMTMINSQASQHGARMASMDNATRNAKDMISDLTLKYNSIRQSAITTELTEIISGAEAL